jgi:putative endonuclease
MKSATATETCWLYFIECTGGGIYIGITSNVVHRFNLHAAGTGALYTKTHPPVQLLFSLPVGTRAEATRLEKRLKKLRPAAKLAWATANGWLGDESYSGETSSW